jgi:hypothetical protein
MSMAAEVHHPRIEDDAVSNVLKWTLLAVAVLTFALFAWATVVTYQTAPPRPDRFVASDRGLLMTGNDILAGKAGFQKADLMDYGSLYGMGSYYGEDYTASTLLHLATAMQNNIALARYGKPFSSSTAEEAGFSGPATTFTGLAAWRLRAAGAAELLSDRLAATGCGLGARGCVCPQ